jgi:hypothetical protein
MADNRGRGPNTPGNDGRLEKNPSRPYENNPVKEQQKKTQGGVNDALKKKK